MDKCEIPYHLGFIGLGSGTLRKYLYIGKQDGNYYMAWDSKFTYRSRSGGPSK